MTRVGHRIDALEKRIEELEEHMSDLDKIVADDTAAESDLEARVAAHEAKDAATIVTIQAQLDALKANDPTAAIAGLTALKAKLQAVDAPAPAPKP